ncbi:MAG: VCBS repeat-containing protein [Acidobacteria bacterium]|nr:VCBS repeat-containing protein [Acidobacteriota bacterium]
MISERNFRSLFLEANIAVRTGGISHDRRNNRFRTGRYLFPLLVGIVSLPWGTISQAQVACSSSSFSAAANFAAETNAGAVAVGDFNRDGMPDLAVANNNPTNTVSILLGDGWGALAPKPAFLLGPVPGYFP